MAVESGDAAEDDSAAAAAAAAAEIAAKRVPGALLAALARPLGSPEALLAAVLHAQMAEAGFVATAAAEARCLVKACVNDETRGGRPSLVLLSRCSCTC